ncbi:hypothetical protein EVAR_74399_1 [Eumeta japonica]|uniref:Uncharacterized protein n=1 Tax=Eumeta variegata TaxID=151549 RepID=A0A4C1SFF0_EUMVA|nr:hypothetical protein EVAR_74399_1 [Eumeta japonica]
MHINEQRGFFIILVVPARVTSRLCEDIDLYDVCSEIGCRGRLLIDQLSKNGPPLHSTLGDLDFKLSMAVRCGGEEGRTASGTEGLTLTGFRPGIQTRISRLHLFTYKHLLYKSSEQIQVCVVAYPLSVSDQERVSLLKNASTAADTSAG